MPFSRRSTRSTPGSPTSRTSRANDSSRSTSAGLIRATTNWDEVRAVDAVLICLPTPLDEHREPDLSAVLGAAESLGSAPAPRPAGRAGEHDVSRHDPRRARAAARAGPDCAPGGISTSRSRPSAWIPGRVDWTTRSTPKVVGGLTPECTRRAAEVYGMAMDTIIESQDPRGRRDDQAAGEHLPHVSTSRWSTSSPCCATAWSIDVWDVIDAAATKPFGLHAVPPGSRARRALHPDRPLLPDLEGPRVRLPHRVHRARGEGQLRRCPHSASRR